MAPTVSLDDGTFHGSSSDSGLTESFLGIPFAEPPVGDRRYRLPLPITPYTGTHEATSFGRSCLQIGRIPPPQGLPADTMAYIHSVRAITFDANGSEDCLTINVIRPAGATADAKLPIAAWIYGGAFQTGATRFYDGRVIVDKSIQLGSPVIYVSFNYRLNGFGFLSGKEVDDAGVASLGLHDQREALRWVQKYIHAFGGDPGRVTIWGESAGAISVALQMLGNNGDNEGLFHGAFMESGSPLPLKDYSSGQEFFDMIVKQTGGADAQDKLAFLRGLPVDTLKSAIDSTPPVVHGGWLPRTGGASFIQDHPQQRVKDGKVARIPFVTGVTDDEGTIFALRVPDVLTDEDFANWIKTKYFPTISDTDLAKLMEVYPADTTQGAPFDTGTANAITPQFKRISAFLGDLLFDGPRRFFLRHTEEKQKSWSYLTKRGKNVPIVGAAHATDIANVFGGRDMTEYLIQFVNTLDPNGNMGIAWPEYDTSDPKVLTFLDGDVPLKITEDGYRREAIEFLNKVAFEHRL